MKNPPDAREQHIRTGRYLKDIIFAASDGIVASFAVVGAAAGGSFPVSVLLVIGSAELFAEALSMASANYLGTRSEQQFYKKEEAEEYREVKEIPDKEREEIREILAAKGYAGADLDAMTALVTSNEKFWVEFMMLEELKLYNPVEDSAMKNAVITFSAFVVAGAIPLLPYLVLEKNATFLLSAVCTAAALFVVGAMRKFFSAQSWIMLGLEMLAVGGAAAAVAYGIGFVIKTLV